MSAIPSEFWTPAGLAAGAGGRWLCEPEDADLPLAGLSIDTRTLRSGAVYLAVRGPRFDGHRFVGDAVGGGAAMVMVTDPDTPLPSSCPVPVCLVDDAVATLGRLATAYRDLLAAGGCQVVAVGGSNGKTTTRHLVYQLAVAGGLRGTQSPKSFNNHLGVPLTLLAASPDDDFVACEIGTSAPGEIAQLAAIVRPDVAVITSIGAEHIAFFGDLDAVAREEYSLLEHLATDGVGFSPRDQLEPYGGEMALAGAHNRLNAAFAEAVALHLGVDEDRIAEALRTATPPPGRLNLLSLAEGVTVIDDTYNANPDSMAAALAVLADLPAARRVAVLGDMLDMGAAADDGHARARAHAEQVADIAVFIGPHFGAQLWTDDLPDRIAAMVSPGDTVLLKASRGMGLERIIPAITARYRPVAGATEPTGAGA